ncbi:MAG: winged helix-turn-helix transcriptional regulator [Thermoplasmata archaeon]|nr:MAG: winged helix-turn-helix transcriptional regulator [Thermoplasmata archaeon]
MISSAKTYTIEFYDAGATVEDQGFIVATPDITIRNTGCDGDTIEWDEFQEGVKIDLEDSQEPDGSWNNDVGDTAVASWGLRNVDNENTTAADRGVAWLQEQDNEEGRSWSSVEDDSKAIMALDSAEVDVWEEIAALMLKQRPDGSFGGTEETSWAVMALSTHPDDRTMASMEKAMTWLRNQNYDNNEDLARAALAEQLYERALIRDGDGDGYWDADDAAPVKGGGGSGYIPPPWLYFLSLFIICSLVLSYWLFARLEKDQALSGVRKDLYKYITEHPGEHLAGITKECAISSSSARYHLSVLEEMDFIVTHKNGKYKRFYINKNGYSRYTNGNGYKHIMSALKNNTARRIVKFLISHPRANQKKVSSGLNLHPSTVNWHAQRLTDAEIISKEKKGKEILYTLNHDVQLRKVIGILEGSPV